MPHVMKKQHSCPHIFFEVSNLLQKNHENVWTFRDCGNIVAACGKSVALLPRSNLTVYSTRGFIDKLGSRHRLGAIGHCFADFPRPLEHKIDPN